MHDFEAALNGHAEGKHVPPTKAVVKFDDLLRGWSKKRSPAKKTIYEWTRVLRQFETFLGQADANRVTADDVIAGKTR